MVIKKISIALTGHRPDKLDGYDLSKLSYQKLQEDLECYIQNKMKSYEVIECHSGLALGADTIWANAILAVKEKNSLVNDQVLFFADIPFWEQSRKWRKNDIITWKNFVDEADLYFVYEPNFIKKSKKHDEYKIAKNALENRNKGMIDACDILLALYDGSNSGGTFNAIKYAKSINKKIVYIDPKKYF